MTIQHRIRLLAQRLGIDVTRYPGSDPLWRVARILAHRRVDVVLDVGANDGGFASQLRRLGFQGRIHSFEPVPSVYQSLVANSRSDELWFTHPVALGDADRTMEIHVAGNAGASSSLLPMLQRHRDAAPESAYTRSEQVTVRRLDGLTETLGLHSDDRLYLKIDVQGFERSVMDGARDLLSSRVVALQMELSLVPLYDGAMTWSDGLEIADSLGMSLVGLNPGFTDRQSGELLQFDAVFVRGDL